MPIAPHHVVVAGGGVAGLEALLALRALAGARVELTLVSPDPDFHYRPLAVARPFGLGHATRTPLADACRDAGATLVQASVTSVDAARHRLHTSEGPIDYDELVLAAGARAERAFARAATWDDRSEDDLMGGLLRDLEEGYSKSLAVVIPPGPGWPLPGYELALLIAREAASMGMEPDIHLVTPEQAPLAIFGPRAIEAISGDLADAHITVHTGAYAELVPGHTTTVRLRPGDEEFDVSRVLALPRLRGRAIEGVPADADGFVEVDEHCRVKGLDDVWAAGDGIAFPVKFGGLATLQADAAARDIAAVAGALVDPEPFRPILRGRLLTGGPARWLRYGAAGGEGDGQAATTALWWPPGKIAGRYLAPWLARRDGREDPGSLPEPHGVPVQMDLHRHHVASG